MKKFLIFCLTTVIICSCKKDNSANNKQLIYDFTSSYYYDAAGNCEICFECTQSDTSEKWSFGDSAGAIWLGQPKSTCHTYTVFGTYQVTLIVNNDTTRPISHFVTIIPDYQFYHTGFPMVGDSISFNFLGHLPNGQE